MKSPNRSTSELPGGGRRRLPNPGGRAQQPDDGRRRGVCTVGGCMRLTSGLVALLLPVAVLALMLSCTPGGASAPSSAARTTADSSAAAAGTSTANGLLQSPADPQETLDMGTGETAVYRLVSVDRMVYGLSRFPEEVLFEDGKAGSYADFAWSFYLLKLHGPGGIINILIDAGFQDAYLQDYFGITEFTPPLELLKSEGLQPKDIDFIIITHGHFDHAWNLNRFPDAGVIINRDAAEDIIRNGRPAGAVAWLEQRMQGADSGGKSHLILLDNDYRLLEILNIRTIGGHAPGSMVVEAETGTLPVLFTGDEIYTLDNLLEIRPSGQMYRRSASIAFLKEFHDAAESGSMEIMAGHDPRPAAVFPTDIPPAARAAVGADGRITSTGIIREYALQSHAP